MATTSSTISLIEEKQKEHRKSSYTCSSVDEFYLLCDNSGHFKGTSRKKYLQNVIIDYPKTYADARVIVNIYNIVYNKTYPFKEMLDPEYVFKSFKNPDYYWSIFRIENDKYEEGKIIGCLTCVLNQENHTGYVRGLNILPTYQKRIGTKEISLGALHQFIMDTKGKIDKWYSECRTAHSAAQFFCQLGGAHAQALLLNKDYFYKEKESDCLMVGYWQKTLDSLRLPPKQMIAAVIPYYELAMKTNHFHDKNIETCFPTVEIDLTKFQEIYETIDVQFIPDIYGYQTIIIQDQSGSNWLQLLYTPTVKNFEKIKYHYTSLEGLYAIFYQVRKISQKLKIEHIEWYIPISDLNAQQMLFKLGWIIEGYVPAWSPVEFFNNKFEDNVVFAWTDRLPSANKIVIVPEAENIINLIGLNSPRSLQKSVKNLEYASLRLEMPAKPLNNNAITT